MPSRSTLFPHNSGHPIIVEFVVAKHDSNLIPYLNVLHYRFEEGTGYDGGQDPPNWGDVEDAMWDVLSPFFLDTYPPALVMDYLDVRVVDDAHLDTHGQVRLDYGDTATVIAADLDPNFGGSVTVPTLLPSYCQIFFRKKVAHSPKDILGSIRLGPVGDNWVTGGTEQRLDPSYQATFQTLADALLDPVSIAASGGSSNTLTATLGLLQKKLVVGTGTPWSFCPAVEELKCRFGLGTQNTRKRVRGTY